MGNQQQILTVTQVAAICGVHRNTVGSWTRSRKLHAGRKDRHDAIFAPELIFFLKSAGRGVPAQSADGSEPAPPFRPIQTCGDDFQSNDYLNGCRECAVLKNRLDACFVNRDPSVPGTDTVYRMNRRQERAVMTHSACPLVEPAGTWLLPRPAEIASKIPLRRDYDG